MGKKRGKAKRVVYSFVVADLFHYGHLQLLKAAKSFGDLHVCGVITDEGTAAYRERPVTNLKERMAIVSSLDCVDRVMVQDSRDPTANLKKLHHKFPKAKIILVHGSDWKEVPGSEYLSKIGGELMKPPYYKRLSVPKIINSLLKRHDAFSPEFDFFTDYFRVKNVTYFDHHKPKKGIISTKADTLKSLSSILKKSRIEKMFVFTVADWKERREELLGEMQRVFPKGRIVARSSALNEDTFESSMAGRFHTELGINPKNKNHARKAVEKVIKSYAENNSYNPENRVLIQSQTHGVKCSGVVFTRSLGSMAPYYVINYDESGKTDTITAGMSGKTTAISRFLKEREIPKRWRGLLAAVREIESVIPGIPLDIEFALTAKPVIFQVRPLVPERMDWSGFDRKVKGKINSVKQGFSKLAKKPKHLAYNTTFLADMPDWNPAEIIGDRPNSLDTSLYAEVIMDSAWHEARTSQGYFNVRPARLMASFAGKPYVNVRNTFNSFVPATVNPALRAKLLSYYMKKLKKNPHLQDKVEFDVLFTIYDLGFGRRAKELKKAGFTPREINSLKRSLLALTNNLVCNSERDIRADLREVALLEKKRKEINTKAKKAKSHNELLKIALELVKECRLNGTVQFSRLARLGFVGKILIKSLASQGTVPWEFYHRFLESVETVATEMNRDFLLLGSGKMKKRDFLKKYGHLRPGTYDITAPRYDRNPQLIAPGTGKKAAAKAKKFIAKKSELERISRGLKKHGLEFNAKELLAFTKAALEAREFSKFEFTKSLSGAIELIAEAGQKLGFLRSEVALLDLRALRSAAKAGQKKTKKEWRALVKKRQAEKEIEQRIILPPVIFSEKDFEIVSFYDSRPNFITKKRIEAEAAALSDSKEGVSDIAGKIVLIENADPGYDWVFTRKPAGMITKYGGTASHMSVRCAEFGLPAAIGAGERLFSLAKASKRILLDCEKGIIEGK